MDIQKICTGLQHVGLPTKNIDATRKFYNTLGFEKIFNTENNGSKVFFLKLGDMVIETYESVDAKEETGTIDHIALNVTDVDAVFSWAKENNLYTTDVNVNYLPFFEAGVKFFTIIGPNGEKIEFIQKILKGE